MNQNERDQIEPPGILRCSTNKKNTLRKWAVKLFFFWGKIIEQHHFFQTLAVFFGVEENTGIHPSLSEAFNHGLVALSWSCDVISRNGGFQTIQIMFHLFCPVGITKIVVVLKIQTQKIGGENYSEIRTRSRPKGKVQKTRTCEWTNNLNEQKYTGPQPQRVSKEKVD